MCVIIIASACARCALRVLGRLCGCLRSIYFITMVLKKNLLSDLTRALGVP